MSKASFDVGITGNLTADPKFSEVKNGCRCYFRIAANDSYRDENGEWQTVRTAFYPCVAWGWLAKEIRDNYHKGDPVVVTGKLEVYQYLSEAAAEEQQIIQIRAEAIGKRIGADGDKE
ncbi:single-strand binding family protein [Mobiluncus mulieris 28-1]|uniref:single-stranded DNA-binding protein n=1 Tax=Mobiluncus mulieris TaxID=2052 RepID=UPI0001BE7EE5|nr:single-stranded DNA-binding protein [Mobiluncus mulieris]EEZ90870.1 single-strand binding family protein [Mobiluncus mulieris 28-1]MCU9971142.1 single-stranded DNA-binding protein [Mobiluncus mulieris]NMW90752.1 single-stranded DNA-binding protein [Mobiluncus mulieris]